MSILMAPDRTSLRTALKCVVPVRLGSDEEASPPGAKVVCWGIGGAGLGV